MKVTKAVIPAAGLGTRMLPATKTVPKEMLPIVDKPALQYVVEEAVASGIEDILLVTGRAKSAMDDYFDYHPELEQRLRRNGRDTEADLIRRVSDMANFSYVRQRETRGLGHAINCAKRFAGDEPFAVLLADDIMRSKTPVTSQLIDAACRYDASVVGVQRVPLEDVPRYCTLKLDDIGAGVFEVHKLVEKPKPEQILSNFAILGRYVLKADIFDELERIPAGHGGEIQLTDAINALCRRRRVLAVDFEGRRYDTGNLCGYLEAVIEFSLEHPDAGPWIKIFLERIRESFHI